MREDVDTTNIRNKNGNIIDKGEIEIVKKVLKQ